MPIQPPDHTAYQFFAQFALAEQSRLLVIDVREICAIEEQRADGFVCLHLKSGACLRTDMRLEEALRTVRNHLPMGEKHG